MPAPAYAAAHPRDRPRLRRPRRHAGGGNAAPAGEPLTIDKADYDAFEQLLGDVQAAYSAEDLAGAARAR